MDADPAYIPVVSRHLSWILDEIGLNSVTVRKKRTSMLICEKMVTWRNRTKGKTIRIYHFGSQTEGTTTIGLGSDVDILTCHEEYNVIQDWSEWKPGLVNFLMLFEDTAPGYCRLQRLRSDMPVAEERCLNNHDIHDKRGRVILKNTVVHQNGFGHARNGPAISKCDQPGITDSDFVHAVRCNTWPKQADEFTRRHRHHTWPPQYLIEEAVKGGVFLVPVGHKLSRLEPLEWRLSASLAERVLMFSLTMVHLKCYVLLKMLVKAFVEPCMKKCISSYHCKTALFHCTKNSDARFWRDDNLLKCVTRCLSLILSWVNEEFCPHFIFSGENLFAGKVNARNKGILQSILTDLIKSNGLALLQVRIDSLGQMLVEKLSTKPSALRVLGTKATLTTMVLIGDSECYLQEYSNAEVKNFLVEHIDLEPIPLIGVVCQKISLLQDQLLVRHSIKQERQAIQVIIEFLFSWLGSLLASLALGKRKGIPKKVLRMFRIRARYDFSALLKLVSILFCSGELRKVDAILKRLEADFLKSVTVPVCECSGRRFRSVREASHMSFRLVQSKGRKSRAKLFAHCVRFTPQEKHCAPPALYQEFSRSAGDDGKQRDPEHPDYVQQRSMDLAAVDCLPYFIYLQYITYRELGMHELQEKSLQNLERCIKEDHGFGHLETAWNLLGQCMELENKPEVAMDCYRTSLEIRPRNNAANCHVQKLGQRPREKAGLRGMLFNVVDFLYNIWGMFRS